MFLTTNEKGQVVLEVFQFLHAVFQAVGKSNQIEVDELDIAIVSVSTRCRHD